MDCSAPYLAAPAALRSMARVKRFRVPWRCLRRGQCATCGWVILYRRQASRVYHRAVGVGCLGSLLIACSGEGPQRLTWEAVFACPADALATEQLTFRVLEGGCSGSEVLYEETLMRG